eukprot:8024294-Pyramimonas_sp.AAC.1
MLGTAHHRRAKGPRLERGQPLGRRGRPQSSRTSEPPFSARLRQWRTRRLAPSAFGTPALSSKQPRWPQ